MARLAAFRVDAKAIEDGEWVRPDEDQWDDLEIRTRGFTDQYRDALAAKLARARRGMPDSAKIPNAVFRSILIELVIKHVIQDVRNLTGPDGQPVNFAAFCDLLRDPSYAELWTATQTAANMVGRLKADETADALGN